MKRAAVYFTLLAFVAGLAYAPSEAATKKSKKTKRSSRYSRNWPKGGPRPVFPTTSSSSVSPAAQSPVITPIASPKPADSGQKLTLKDCFVESGYGGGALVAEFGYMHKLKDNMNYSGAVGLGVGNGYSILVLDPVRFTYDARSFFAGAGLNYAMYSAKVENIPGISGAIPTNNLFGVEVFCGKHLGRYNARLAYSTALGIRAAVGYAF